MTDQMAVFYKEVLPAITKNGMVVSRQDILSACSGAGMKWPPTGVWRDKVGRGMFDLTHIFKNQNVPLHIAPVVDERTDEEIEKEITDRFEALDRMTLGFVDRKYTAMIASGNPGIGKTWSIEYILEAAAADDKIQFTEIKGYVRATGIYKLLYENRFKNCVLLFDDADSVFDDEVGLNLLKSALDTTKRRRISWRSEAKLETTDGEMIPNTFDYEGMVIFITNKNFDNEIRRNSKIAVHLEALISRTFYVDLNLLNQRELMIRIRNVVNKTDMLSATMKKSEIKEILNFMEENMGRLRELSLRMALKLSQIYRGARDAEDFKKMARATCIKRS